MTLSIRISKPDDWHVHFRDHELLQNTVPATSQHFYRALVMPNLNPPLTNIADLLEYRTRILSAIPKNHLFEPYMTLYLNESLTPETLIEAKKYPFILGAKLYPAGVTTNAEQGARSIRKLYPLLEIMQEQNLVLQIHGEQLHGDIFEREALFIKSELEPIIQNFPRLRIVLEHISTREAVDFILHQSHEIAATITPHHLLYHRNHLLAGGIKPHFYCLPILKHEQDQKALLKAALSGDKRFFAGTDSAPHAKTQKENACGCAGIYSAPYALSLYTKIFMDHHKSQQLEPFLSHFGADFYQLPRQKTNEIELICHPQNIPKSLPLGNQTVVPIEAGHTLEWSVYVSH